MNIKGKNVPAVICNFPLVELQITAGSFFPESFVMMDTIGKIHLDRRESKREIRGVYYREY